MTRKTDFGNSSTRTDNFVFVHHIKMANGTAGLKHLHLMVSLQLKAFTRMVSWMAHGNTLKTTANRILRPSTSTAKCCRIKKLIRDRKNSPKKLRKILGNTRNPWIRIFVNYTYSNRDADGKESITYSVYMRTAFNTGESTEACSR